MMICFFHKKQIINFSSSTLRGRAYPRLAPQHVKRELLNYALLNERPLTPKCCPSTSLGLIRIADVHSRGGSLSAAGSSCGPLMRNLSMASQAF
jgi:hypothetical protein